MTRERPLPDLRRMSTGAVIRNVPPPGIGFVDINVVVLDTKEFRPVFCVAGPVRFS